MIYEFSHYLQNKVPCVWSAIEWCNSMLFQLRYRFRLSKASVALNDYPDIYAIDKEDVDNLVGFFERQPQEAFVCFKPHAFDEHSLSKLQRRKSFLMYCVKDGSGQIVGYFFLRCFFVGKAFLGKMVDSQCQGQGIGKKMCGCAMDIASAMGLRMYETISKDNLSSLHSTQDVLESRIIKEMDNNYLYIEDLRKK